VLVLTQELKSIAGYLARKQRKADRDDDARRERLAEVRSGIAMVIGGNVAGLAFLISQLMTDVIKEPATSLFAYGFAFSLAVGLVLSSVALIQIKTMATGAEGGLPALQDWEKTWFVFLALGGWAGFLLPVALIAGLLFTIFVRLATS
jgi:hypothetical protein